MRFHNECLQKVRKKNIIKTKSFVFNMYTSSVYVYIEIVVIYLYFNVK